MSEVYFPYLAAGLTLGTGLLSLLWLKARPQVACYEELIYNLANPSNILAYESSSSSQLTIHRDDRRELVLNTMLVPHILPLLANLEAPSTLKTRVNLSPSHELALLSLAFMKLADGFGNAK